MTILNHAGVTRTKAPLAVVVLQMLFSVIGATVASGSSLISQFKRGTTLWACTVPILFSMMLATSMVAFEKVSVGAFVVVRNLGPVVTFAVEVSVHRSNGVSCSAKSLLSCAAIALGVYIYASNDIHYNSAGLALIVVNLVIAVAERMLQRHLLAVNKVDVTKNGLVILNNAVGAALISGFVVSYDFYQFERLYNACSDIDDGFNTTTVVFLSCVAGIGLAYSGVWLQARVLATSFMVVGSSTKMAVVLWGIIMENDSKSPEAIAGAVLSVVGALVYGVKCSVCNVRRYARQEDAHTPEQELQEQKI